VKVEVVPTGQPAKLGKISRRRPPWVPFCANPQKDQEIIGKEEGVPQHWACMTGGTGNYPPFRTKKNSRKKSNIEKAGGEIFIQGGEVHVIINGLTQRL